MKIADLRARRHEPPLGWPRETFEQLTDALAAALVAGWRRRQMDRAQAEEREQAIESCGL